MISLPKFKLPERKQREPINPRLLLIHITAFVTGCAALTEWCWALIFCIEATGKIGWNVDWASGNTDKGFWQWSANFGANIPVLLALMLATVPIVLWSMIWLPFYQQAQGTGRARRVSMAAAGVLANALVILSGTIVMNGNRQEHVRADLVVEQSAEAQRAAIRTQIDAVNSDLARLTDKRVNNEYAATAASVGAEAYQRDYMSAEALRRSPAERRDIIVRALGAAKSGDALRAKRTGLINDLANAKPTAATQAVVEDNYGAGMNAFAQYAQVYRPPFVALICTLIGIWGAWWLVGVWERYAAEHMAPANALAIEDHSQETKLEVEPSLRMGKMVDAETGEELIPVRGSKPHVRKKGAKKNGRQEAEVAIAPQTLPDEQGFVVATDPRAAANAEDAEAEEARAAGQVEVESADAKTTLGRGGVDGSDRADVLDNVADSGADFQSSAGAPHSFAPSGDTALGGSHASASDESETLNAQPQEDSADDGATTASDPVVEDESASRPEAGADASLPELQEAPQPVTLQEAADKVAAGEWVETGLGIFEPVPHEESGPTIEAEDTNFMATRRGLPAPEKADAA